MSGERLQDQWSTGLFVASVYFRVVYHRHGCTCKRYSSNRKTESVLGCITGNGHHKFCHNRCFDTHSGKI